MRRNNQSIRMVCLQMVLLLTACGTGSGTSASSEVSPMDAESACNEMISMLADRNDKFLVDYSDEDRKLYEEIGRECPASFDRDFQLANYLYLTDQYEKALIIFMRIKSNDPIAEPKRLVALFSMYSRSDPNRSTVYANEVIERFPSSVYAKQMRGLMLCDQGRCGEALSDLIEANSELRNLTTLANLGYSYADHDRYEEAARCFDIILAEKYRIRALTDLTMYVGVVSYVNMGRYAEANQLYENFVSEISKGGRSKNIDKAAAILDGVAKEQAEGLQDSQEVRKQ